MPLFKKENTDNDSSKEKKPKKESRKEEKARIAAEEAAEMERLKAEAIDKERQRLSELSEKELMIEILLKLHEYEDRLDEIQDQIDHIGRDASKARTQSTIASLNASAAALRK